MQPKICDHYSWLIVYLATYTALHSSYHIGEPIFIPKLLLPCVYDTMIMQFYYWLVSYYNTCINQCNLCWNEAL